MHRRHFGRNCVENPDPDLFGHPILDSFPGSCISASAISLVSGFEWVSPIRLVRQRLRWSIFILTAFSILKRWSSIGQRKIEFSLMHKISNRCRIWSKLSQYHAPSREHFSLKIDVRDQTIWNCMLEL